MVGNRPVKAYHFSWGGINKKHPKHLFTKEVVDFIYSTIVTDNMIAIKRADGVIIDLSPSEKFKAHYNKSNTYAKYIIENEINPGIWHDSLLDTIHKDAVIVDCGANVGLFTAYMSNGNGRKFYCVEPTHSHCEVAVELFEKLKINYHIFEGVVSNLDGDVTLFEEASNSTMNRIGINKNGGSIVRSLTLKTLFENWKLEHVNLLKLDIESAEQQVIMEDETVGEALKKCSIVLIEVHPQDGFGNKVDVEGIINKMKSFGFIHKEGAKGLAHYFYQIPN